MNLEIKIAQLETKFIELEKDVIQNQKDVRLLLDFMSGVKMLMYLSVGGGGLSIITLILTLMQLLNNGSP